ncbi:MAG: hypothetical protein N2Z66_01090, partial [Tepidimonas sp.]|nr:hypothetical protein [Tepidimonas sp.]
LAREVRALAPPTIPSWARQLEAFLLADDEPAAAAALLALYLRDGVYRDENEARFLAERLAELTENLPPQPR